MIVFALVFFFLMKTFFPIYCLFFIRALFINIGKK